MTTTLQEPTQETLLTARGLTVSLPLSGGGTGQAVKGVDLTVKRGEIVGVVGESGSGKTLLALSIIGLLPDTATSTAESLDFEGHQLLKLNDRAWREIRGESVAMVFQDPLSSLNPVRTIGSVMRAAHRRHHDSTKAEATAAALEALTRAGVPAPAERLGTYPHELSGGLRQRVLIALALINSPSLLIADEPTTALDATVQAQLLRLLRKSADERALIFITHDLGAAAEICNRIIVMYAGRIVEEGPTEEVLAHPTHPYTAGLMGARPEFSDSEQVFTPIPGSPPRLGDKTPGCSFAPRCSYSTEQCTQLPELRPFGQSRAACWHPLNAGDADE